MTASLKDFDAGNGVLPACCSGFLLSPTPKQVALHSESRQVAFFRVYLFYA